MTNRTHDTTLLVQSDHGPATEGLVLGFARVYDALAWLFTAGKEAAFRQRILDLAELRPGESVLDIGCGTGTLAIAAAERVDPGGRIHGIDAAPAMIARASAKARAAGAQVDFRRAVVEAIPFDDASFDVVLSSLMMHHLPPSLRQRCALELRRVLRPGGRAVVVDFGAGEGSDSWIQRLHRHGSVDLKELIGTLETAGLSCARSGSLDYRGLDFVVALAPAS